MKPDEFYRLRDDRTSRIVKGLDYHQLRVRLVADTEAVHVFGGQVQLLLAANMLARWCRQIEFGFPNAQLLPHLRIREHETIYDRIRSAAAEADPFGNFQFCEVRSPEIEYTLKIGNAFLRNEIVDFTIDAGGWRAWAGSGHQTFDTVGDDFNLASAAFAACIGVADAFKVAIGLPNRLRVKNTSFSLLDFSVGPQALTDVRSDIPTPARVNLGNIQIVGVGSVGSAVIFLLGMLQPEGNIVLIDHDPVKIVNLNRSPLFGIFDVGKAKVVVAREYLGDELVTDAFIGRYDEFIEQHGRQPGKADLLLSLANEYGVRGSVEHNFPPLQVYGTTTIDWGINYHRHIPLRGDCSVCRYPLDDIPVQMACSEAQLQTKDGDQVDAALPFASVATAALIVADLLKLQLTGYPFTPNFAFVDLKGPLEFVLAYDKQRRQGCLCSSRSTNIHNLYITSTRYSELSGR